MSDIIERLHGPDGIEAAREITRLREDLASAKRAAAAYEAWKFPEDIQELTVENERLREENARLREALQPFADAAEGFRDEVSDEYPFQFGDFRLGQCRAAAAAIREGGKDG